MLIHFGYEIQLLLNQQCTIQLLLDLHPSRQDDLVGKHLFAIKPSVPSEIYRDVFGNIARRFSSTAGKLVLTAEGTVRDSGLPDTRPDARAIPVGGLQVDVMVFLQGSRYCETDLLSEFAWSQFGSYTAGSDQVQAICDFVHSTIRFDYQAARSTRTAAETQREQVGVCRDFAHLAIALCRALNIPARYCNGYLGDIGVPSDPAPMDFNAWFEVYLEGGWFIYDARHNTPRIGRILLSRGRDAADTAMVTTFGSHTLTKFTVVTDEVFPSADNKKVAAATQGG